ncbi:MAG: sulfatase-like hydrolase/transferase [Opitutales bacterium]
MKKSPIFLLLFTAASLFGEDRPNILWLTSEDNNINWVGAYGNPHADTPNIDQMAKDGFQYMNCFANAPVCAPSRSTWITGMLSIANGTYPMRSRYEIPHDKIPYYPDQLRKNGYYVANDEKTDFNIGGRKDSDPWDHHGKIEWDKLVEKQPFFQVLNHKDSHESRAFKSIEGTLHDPANTQLRAYHPDVPDMRKNYALYHDAVKRMDTKIGEALAKLESLGLAENTIVIYVSDHGGVLPRSKRFIFQSGIHCPLIVRIPEKFKHLYPAEAPGSKIDDIVSFVDMPKTWLSITGSEIPDSMQGRVFLGKNDTSKRDYHFAFRGRTDERLDNARAITDGDFLYIRNYMPYVPWMQRLDYLWRMAASQAWEKAYKEGQTDEAQSKFFKPRAVTEELYNMRTDPDNVNNLSADPEYASIMKKLRKELRRQQLKYNDTGLITELEMAELIEETGLTAYEIARTPSLYNLPALLDAADLALAEDPANIPALESLLASPDVGQRYWAIVGCFLLNHSDVAATAMKDSSDEVRAMAAWLAYKTGDTEAGADTLISLIEQNSYATLTALNIIDWMGDNGKELVERVNSLTFTKEPRGYIARFLGYLATKY